MASSPNWNGFLSRIGSRNASRELHKRYAQLPMEDPFMKPASRLSLASIRSQDPSMKPRSQSTFQATKTELMFGSSTTEPTENLQEASEMQPLTRKQSPRHMTVQIGAMREVQSRLALPDSLADNDEEEEGHALFEDMQELENDLEVELQHDPESCVRFVVNPWFQAISGLVIIVNVIATIIEMDKPETEHVFLIPDQLMLSFYVTELILRISYFGSLFLLGPCAIVAFNVLDIVVVVAGVIEEWLMPVLPAGNHSESLSTVLRTMRLLRLLRVFKIVRIFLNVDLSWTEAPAFQSFIGVVIAVNSLLMGMEIDIPWSGWFYFEQVLLVIYVFELSVRLKNFGRSFFECQNPDVIWNVLDFIIVTSSVLDSWLTPLCKITMKSLAGPNKTNSAQEHGMSLGKVMMLMRMLRLMRILRLAKLVKSVRPLFILVTGVMAALQGVVWVLVLTIVTLYAMGILATSLIGKKMAFPPDSDVPFEIVKPFATVPESMFTLFRVMSGAASEDEQNAIDGLMENCPSIKLGFVFFMITSSWTLLSILTAVVSENMISTTGQQEEEIKIQNAEEDRKEHVKMLKKVFNIIDVRGDGQVQKHDIECFLADKKNAMLTARSCRVPVRDVREVLQTVAEACDESTINLETFVDYLADVSNVVTEKSVMKIESKLTSGEKSQKEQFIDLNSSVTNLSRQICRLELSVRSKVEEAVENQIKEVQRLMQLLLERTDTCLNGIQKNQLLQKTEQELCMPLPAPDSLGGREACLILDSGTWPLEDNRRDKEGQLYVVNKNQTDVAEIAREPVFQMELPVAVVALEKFSSSLDFELHMMKQALVFCLGQQSPDTSRSRSTTDSDNKLLPPAVEIPTDLAGRAKGVQMEVPTAQREPLRKVEALLAKVVEQRLSAMEHEFHTLRDEFLGNLGGQDCMLSRSIDDLEKDTGLATTDTSSIIVDQMSSVTGAFSSVEGDVGSSPGVSNSRK